MMENRTRDWLSSVYEEAILLRDKHNGVHNMHGACWAIGVALQSLDSGCEVNYDQVDLIIRRMRFCDANGRYPKRGEVECSP